MTLLIRLAASALACLFLLAPASVSAQQTVTPAPGRTISLQSRADRPGDAYRFVSETVLTDTGEGAGRQTNRLVFDIEVLASSAERKRLRYTLREAMIEDDRQPGIQQIVRSWIGVAVEVETYPGYTPLRLRNWPQARAAFLKALDAGPPLPAGARDTVVAYYDRQERNPAELARAVVGDLFVLAGMQIPAVAEDAMRLPVDPRPAPGGGVILEDATIAVDRNDSDRCMVTFVRVTRRRMEGEGKPFDYDLQTRATLSSRDGWTLELTETEVVKTDERGSNKTVTIRRLTPGPGCGEI